jgi:hypothetical protein
VVGRRLLAPALVGLLAVAACVALGLLALRGDGGEGAVETKREASVRAIVQASLRPPVHRFGEPVTGRIELTLRRAELDPKTGGPSADFDPYTAIGPARRELHEFGALARLRFTVVVQCLKQACLPDAQTGEFEFGSAAVGWRVPPPPGRKFRDLRLDSRNARASWPTLRVTSWLTPEDVQAARWRSTLGELPPPSYAVAPRWLAAGLLGAAVALVLLAAGLLVGPLRSVLARRAVGHAPDTESPPLERAIVLVEESRLNGDVPGRRVALETLARELRRDGERELAADAERLAWSPGAPPDGDVATLLAGVRSSLDGGSR